MEILKTIANQLRNFVKIIKSSIYHTESNQINLNNTLKLVIIFAICAVSFSQITKLVTDYRIKQCVNKGVEANTHEGAIAPEAFNFVENYCSALHKWGK